jgi:hypothetical protein
MVSPHHPFLGITFNISLLASAISFGYYFNQEMGYVSRMPYSDIGDKIRKLKNELVLYNPLVKPVEVENVNENRKI